VIHLNNRKVLSGIAEVCGETDKIVDITVAIDKLDKIGEDGVVEELRTKGVSEEAIQKIRPLFHLQGENQDLLNNLSTYLSDSLIGQQGVAELQYVLDTVAELGLERGILKLDVTLARGLNYYTGAIFEVKALGVKMGSICGGGRYDDLTGLFGLKGLSGVGISFGADRIFDVLNELALFPKEVTAGLPLMFVNFGEKEALQSLKLATALRKKGMLCEVYPSAAKMQKQMKYANDRGTQFVALLGENELISEQITLKNMESGTQETYSWSDFLEKWSITIL
jgi:histidyl-tRNA synthetase